jgi:hypothetical protein
LLRSPLTESGPFGEVFDNSFAEDGLAQYEQQQQVTKYSPGRLITLGGVQVEMRR